MRCFTSFVHLLLLFTVPSLILFPHAEVPAFNRLIQETSIELKPRIALFLTFDEILDLIDELETGELEKRCSLADLERINHFLTALAREGILPNELERMDILENDIAELLYDENDFCRYAFSLDRGDDYVITPDLFYEQGAIIRCKEWWKKKWDQAKSFVKKHKKAILIGGLVAVGVGAIALIVPAMAGAGKKDEDESSIKSEDQTTPSDNDTPMLKTALEEQISSFKELIVREDLLQTPPHSSGNESSIFEEKARNLGAFFAHETLEGIFELASFIPQLSEEIREIGARFLSETPDYFQINPMENHKQFLASAHQKIDQAFSTDQTLLYSPEANTHKNDFAIGILPPPGNFSSEMIVSKVREVIKTGQQVTLLAEELGFTAREIAQLKQAGTLEETLASSFERMVKDRVIRESCETFKKAEAFLKPYHGQYLSELQARELIHQCGIRTFPRPQGIPENFRIKLADKGSGVKYVHPKNNHTYVRIMPGKPHSYFPNQREPYVNRRVNGQSLDKHGNIVPNDSPEAHIPINEFFYRE